MVKQILAGPVVRTKTTTKQVMIDVAIALLPCWIAGIIFFGLPALWIVLLSTLTAILVEAAIMRYPLSVEGIIADGSALVTGLLVGLILPSTVPWWIPIIGSIFAITLGKLVFGGLGSNIFNPALVGRAILLLAFTAPMVKFVSAFDAVTQATPLITMRSFDWSLVWGNVGGSIGETSVIAILLGGVFLLYRRHIDWRIPTGYVVSAFLVALIWGLDPWMAITAGGLLFAAIFMATDMVTSPVTPLGRVLFGCGCGILTIFLRRFTSFPEGVTFAILTMNAVVPLLDKLTVPVIFGARRSRDQNQRTAAAVVVIVLVAGGFLAVVNYFAPEQTPVVAEGVYLPLTETLGSNQYQTVTINDKVYYFTGEIDAVDKVALVGSEEGYHDPIYFYLVVDATGEIEYLQILSHSEDPGLGSLITRDSFISQFIGLNPESELALGSDIQGITGATISSRAVINGVSQELERFLVAFYGEETSEVLPLSDGVYLGEANSFGGNLKVEVTIVDGSIAAVTVLEHSDTPGLSDEAIKLIPQRIIDAGGTDIDVASGATVTSKGIMDAVDRALAQASEAGDVSSPEAEPELPVEIQGIAANLSDGTYRGTGMGFVEDIVVDLTVVDGMITEIEVVSHGDTPVFADPAFEELIPAIIEQQAIVDGRTGATFSSEGLFAAVNAAINGEEAK